MAAPKKELCFVVATGPCITSQCEDVRNFFLHIFLCGDWFGKEKSQRGLFDLIILSSNKSYTISMDWQDILLSK